MHGSLLVEVPAGPYLPERRYVLDVVLGEWLGLGYRLEVKDRADVRLTLADDPEGKALVLPDVLFQTPEVLWLTPAVLPDRPLTWWCTPPWVSEGHEISTWLPVLYGRQGAGGYLHEDGDTLSLGLDVFGSAFFMLTRLEEVVRPATDAYGRFPATASVAFQEGFLERPLVNEYVELLWRAMKRQWPALGRTPTASTTRSASMTVESCSSTRSASGVGVKAAAAVASRTSMPRLRRCCSTGTAVSWSSGGRIWSASSTTCTCACATSWSSLAAL